MASPPKFDRAGNEVKSFLVRVPKSLDDRVREKAYSENTSKADVVRRALSLYLGSR